MFELMLLFVATIGIAAGLIYLGRQYVQTFNIRHALLMSILLLALIDAWITLYFSTTLPQVLQFRFLLTLVPIGLYGVYAAIEKKHKTDEYQKVSQATQKYHLPAIIEDILKHPEKRAILEEILKHPEKTTLGGTRKHLTIMFTDIRGFTELSEKLNPDELIAFLNDYLNSMSQLVIDNQGIVDKYIGDAIMAFWGPPIESPHHMILAVKTAVEMADLLHKKRMEWQSRGLPDINVGIGINAGEVVVGNIGCEQRFDYTCVGDHVNLAERLQEFNKIYGTTIIITEPVFKAVSKSFVCRELDIVGISGKQLPILLYEVLGKTVDQKTQAFLHYYKKAFSLFRKHSWPEARLAFDQALALRKDKVSKILLERCIKYIEHPPQVGDSLWESY